MRSLPLPARGEVHLWRTALDAVSATHEHDLDTEERERAARFRSERDRRRWVAARAALRAILGTYLDEDPSRIRLVAGEQGKPALEAPLGNRALRFNASHSGGLAVYAFAVGREVGVDVEAIRADLDVLPVARRVLSRDAVLTLAALPDQHRRPAFFTEWVRYEAAQKCLGLGLGLGLGGRLPSVPVTVVDLDLGAGYAGALAVEGERPRVVARTWRLGAAGMSAR
jgi:4'-phosphopantetheinyl transferase